MAPPRIVVADSSLIIRKVISDALKNEPAFELVGTAGDGELALISIAALQPDLVVLGDTMPLVGGPETLAVLTKEFPEIRVVMFRTPTPNKPIDSAGLATTIEAIQKDLIPRIKSLLGITSPIQLSL